MSWQLHRIGLILFITLGTMLLSGSTYLYNITNNADDWYWSSTTGGDVIGTTTLKVTHNLAIAGTEIIEYSRMNINTSLIPDTDSINTAYLWFYNDAYTVSGRPAPSRDVEIYIWSGSNWIGVGTLTSVAIGWLNIELDSTAKNYINKTAVTQFVLYVPGVVSGQSRAMSIRAKEYTGAFGAYLNITHAATTTTTTTTTTTSTTSTTLCGSTGDWVISVPTLCENHTAEIGGNWIINNQLIFKNMTLSMDFSKGFLWLNRSFFFRWLH